MNIMIITNEYLYYYLGQTNRNTETSFLRRHLADREEIEDFDLTETPDGGHLEGQNQPQYSAMTLAKRRLRDSHPDTKEPFPLAAHTQPRPALATV